MDVTLLVARQLLGVDIDEMGVEALTAFRDAELVPQLRATMEYLSERNALADPETGGHREEILALRKFITAVNDRLRELEVQAMLAAVAELAARPIHHMSVLEIRMFQMAELEPMVTTATEYLEARGALNRPGLLIDEARRVEMIALEARIDETNARVLELESLAMLAEVAETAAIGMTETIHRDRRHGAGSQPPAPGSQPPAPAPAVAGGAHSMSKEQLTELRVGTLEPKLHEATEYLEERGWLTTREGEPHAEMEALQGRIRDTLTQEMNLMLREATR